MKIIKKLNQNVKTFTPKMYKLKRLIKPPKKKKKKTHTLC